MSSVGTVNDLAERKRLLVLQAELHRQIIAIERARLQQRAAGARERFAATRWWVVGGVALLGWLSTRRVKFLVKRVPLAMTAWRMMKMRR